MRKIGDTVRIREDLHVGDYDGILVQPTMVQLAGKTATITEIYMPTPWRTLYKLDIDKYDWSWNDSTLEAEEEDGVSVEAFEPQTAEIQEEPEETEEEAQEAGEPVLICKVYSKPGEDPHEVREKLKVFLSRQNISVYEAPPADTYEAAIRDQIEHCWELLFSKRKEYATADPFHNFRRAADLQGITKEQALIGMMDKHVISVHDMVNEAAEGASFSAAKWREKIGDNINYLLILWAMVLMEGGAE